MCLDHVQARDPQTLCDVPAGLRAAATMLIANQAMETDNPIEFPADLRA